MAIWSFPRVYVLPLSPSHAGTSQASTFQMAILLQYNTEDAYAVQQLADSTQIKVVSRRPAPRRRVGVAGRAWGQGLGHASASGV